MNNISNKIYYNYISQIILLEGFAAKELSSGCDMVL